MIAVDTNILIYAHRGETELDGAAALRLIALAEGAERWALPVFCVTEFMRVVMHRRVFNPPSTVAQATAFIESIADAPSCEVVQPGPEFLELLIAVRSPGRFARQPDVRRADSRALPRARHRHHSYERPRLRTLRTIAGAAPELAACRSGFPSAGTSRPVREPGEAPIRPGG